MKRGKRVLSLVLCLGLVCALAAPAKAAEEVTITWLPEGVTPLDASYWSVKGDKPQLGSTVTREVKKGDLIAVERDGKYGYVDLSGELVIPLTEMGWLQPEYIFFFSDGLLPVPQYDSDGDLTGTNYVDRTGKTVLELGDKAWGFVFSDGVALVAKPDSWGETKIGAIDTKGNTVVPYEYDDANLRSMGFVGGFVTLAKENDEGHYEPFFVSIDGKTVIPISEYDKVRHFSEGLAAVCKDGKWGYIDTAGNLKIPCEYDRYYDESVMDFREGMVVLCKDGKCGYANAKGEIVIPPQYPFAMPFSSEGTAVVKGEDGEKFVIDKTGKKLEDETVSAAYEKLAAEGYEYGEIRDDNLICITKDEKHGLADKHGEIVIPAEYGMLKGSSGLFYTSKAEKYGFINKKGEVVVPFEFELDKFRRDGLIMNGYIGVVYQNGRYGIFENPYYEEPKPAGLFSFGDRGSSSGGGSPLLPVAGVLAVAVAGGLVLLKKKKRPQA